ncbi:phosphatase PAP2 family protein [Niallia sp. Krafla_26]|uniref:phosphatase PAP2 family protein n=1 Tax=Niallia sp. Krafla_26 TaxID=3064703 RepID=UPI003D17103C
MEGIVNRSKKKFTYISSAITVIIIFIVLFIYISKLISKNALVTFDHTIITAIQSAISDRNTLWMLMITELGSVKWITIFVILTAVWLLYKKKYSLAIFMMAASGIGALFNMWLKWLFKRERPDILPLLSEESFSFPSGHAMGSFIFYGSLAYLIIHLVHKKSWQLFSIVVNALFILFIGLSRIYLGVHFPSDIVGGYLAGSAWLLSCIILFRYYEYRHNL